MVEKVFNKEQLEIIEDTIKSVSEREKLIDYLNRHDIVGNEIFPYLIKSKSDIKYEYIYNPQKYDVFIKRLPIYFYENKVESGNIGDFSQYAIGLYQNMVGHKEYAKKLEELYNTVEWMYYHHKLELSTIFNYPVDQTGYVSKTNFLMQWANYLDLIEEYRLENNTPDCFIVEYNYVLEKAGMKPIVYDIEEQFSGEYVFRTGNIIKVEGVFPCDENGNPIMRWIGIDVIDSTKIWAEVNEKSEGYLYIKVNPKTAIWGLNCWGLNEDGTDCWYRLYVGPLLMEFDYKRLKQCRQREKLTQKQVAEAIGSAERTYQKWESGTTTPDCIYLLRLMNILNIKEVDELTRVIS